MGISSQIVEALLRESAFRPIRGDALLIGRQTVYYTAPQILQALRENGVTPAINAADIETDAATIDRLSNFADKVLISDTSLMRLVGADRVLALDHSSYEHAEIVHDLRKPIADELADSADVLVDGSTLDNVFTPATVLQNFARLLRPGGRMFLCNAFSSFESAYVIMPPMWYVDYFVMNGFSDCRAYVFLFSGAQSNAFAIELSDLYRLKREMGIFPVAHCAATLMFAEKGEHSTWDRLPNQQDYRSAEDWEIYQSNLAKMLDSKRPHLARSNGEPFVPDVQRGYRFIDREFQIDDAALKHGNAARNKQDDAEHGTVASNGSRLKRLVLPIARFARVGGRNV